MANAHGKGTSPNAPSARLLYLSLLQKLSAAQKLRGGKQPPTPADN
jgi:hypothetical protein